MPDNRWRWTKPLPALLLQVVLLILAISGFSSSAQAHRVLVFAYVEGETIHTESKFVPDTPVRQGKILVLDGKSGKELLTGQTDNRGKFSFKIPAEAAAQKLDLKVVVEAAMGHRGEWLLKAGSYLTGGAAPGSPAAPAQPGPTATLAASAPGSKDSHIPMDQQGLEAALDKVLERQLGPINEKLTELTIHRTSMSDIIGGLGYILGLFGLAAYFLSKRKKDS